VYRAARLFIPDCPPYRRCDFSRPWKPTTKHAILAIRDDELERIGQKTGGLRPAGHRRGDAAALAAAETSRKLMW
jgi:hypothetical protein